MTLKANKILTDTELNDALAATTGDRVHADDMDRRISSVSYLVMANTTVTICTIALDNGYSVRGESSCVDPSNFNEAIGRTYAYKDAYQKLWPLFGFLLAEKRHIRRQAAK